MNDGIATTSTVIEFLFSYLDFNFNFNPDFVNFYPLIFILLTTLINYYVVKKDKFDIKVEELLQKILDKKVTALALLIDSVQFINSKKFVEAGSLVESDNFGSLVESGKFKGKKFFIDIDKFSTKERDVKEIRKKFKFQINILNWITITALITIALFFFSLDFIGDILVFIMTLALGIVFYYIKKHENSIQTIAEDDDLRHNE